MEQKTTVQSSMPDGVYDHHLFSCDCNWFLPRSLLLRLRPCPATRFTGQDEIVLPLLLCLHFCFRPILRRNNLTWQVPRFYEDQSFLFDAGEVLTIMRTSQPSVFGVSPMFINELSTNDKNFFASHMAMWLKNFISGPFDQSRIMP